MIKRNTNVFLKIKYIVINKFITLRRSARVHTHARENFLF
nr:MAG TPA: hypothetical protein [Caudoviricetes sp.]